MSRTAQDEAFGAAAVAVAAAVARLWTRGQGRIATAARQGDADGIGAATLLSERARWRYLFGLAVRAATRELTRLPEGFTGRKAGLMGATMDAERWARGDWEGRDGWRAVGQIDDRERADSFDTLPPSGARAQFKGARRLAWERLVWPVLAKWTGDGHNARTARRGAARRWRVVSLVLRGATVAESATRAGFGPSWLAKGDGFPAVLRSVTMGGITPRDLAAGRAD